MKRKVTIQGSVVQELTVSSSTTSQKLSKRSESLLGVLWSRNLEELKKTLKADARFMVAFAA